MAFPNSDRNVPTQFPIYCRRLWNAPGTCPWALIPEVRTCRLWGYNRGGFGCRFGRSADCGTGLDIDEVRAGGAEGGRIRNIGRTLLRRDFLGKDLRLCRFFPLRPGRDQNGRGAAQHDDSQHNGDRNSESPSPHNTSPRPQWRRSSKDQQALSCRSGARAVSGSPTRNQSPDHCIKVKFDLGEVNHYRCVTAPASY